MLNKLKENLVIISRDLHMYDVKRESLFTYCINKKLEAAMLKYKEDINLDAEWVLINKNEQVLRALTQNKKYNDKEFLDNVINKKFRREVD